MQPSLAEIQHIIRIPEYDWTPSDVLAPAEFDIFKGDNNVLKFVYRYRENLMVLPVGDLSYSNIPNLKMELGI